MMLATFFFLLFFRVSLCQRHVDELRDFISPEKNTVSWMIFEIFRPHRAALILTRDSYTICWINYLFSWVSRERCFELMKCDVESKKRGQTLMCGWIWIELKSLSLCPCPASKKLLKWVVMMNTNNFRFLLIHFTHFFSLLIKQFRLSSRIKEGFLCPWQLPERFVLHILKQSSRTNEVAAISFNYTFHDEFAYPLSLSCVICFCDVMWNWNFPKEESKLNLKSDELERILSISTTIYLRANGKIKGVRGEWFGCCRWKNDESQFN